MNTKDQLKLELDKLESAKTYVSFHEQGFHNRLRRWDNVCRSNGNLEGKKLYTRMEDSRTRWWKSIDKKMDIESNIKILEKKLLNEIKEEMK